MALSFRICRSTIGRSTIYSDQDPDPNPNMDPNPDPNLNPDLNLEKMEDPGLNKNDLPQC